ncbi:hypothetical protein B0H16DRAFT_1022465 [Mycena metata]|uniref:Uncharacterized protein n=1 Tax=Mycena metata TaxID=1033252 RepID=A0AAD7IJ12_9AGAR|nr:hypothetical protein B0H16DRAFT_1022465 [Mycena metata]
MRIITCVVLGAALRNRPPLGSMDSLVMVPPRWSARSARACARPPRYLILKPIFFSPSSLLFSVYIFPCPPSSSLLCHCSVSYHLFIHRARPAASTSHVGRGTAHGHGDGDGWGGRMGAGAGEGCRGECGGGACWAARIGGGSSRGRDDRQSPRPLRDVLASRPDVHVRRPPTPAASMPLTPAPGHASSSSTPPSSTPALTGSAIALPYCMLCAFVATDTVAIYDTQQTGPVCLLTKLRIWHSPRTGAPVARRLLHARHLDKILPTHHTQQAAGRGPAFGADFVPVEFASIQAAVGARRKEAGSVRSSR